MYLVGSQKIRGKSESIKDETPKAGVSNGLFPMAVENIFSDD
jgi:hypothetical protein